MNIDTKWGVEPGIGIFMDIKIVPVLFRYLERIRLTVMI
jgi:hypothetical protein